MNYIFLVFLGDESTNTAVASGGRQRRPRGEGRARRAVQLAARRRARRSRCVQCSTRRPRPHIAPRATPPRRLPALPHHASAGRVARAAGQAREPAAAGLVAGGRHHRRRFRSGLSAGPTGGAARVRLLPLLRERAGVQLAADPRQPTGKARLHTGTEYHGSATATRASKSHGAVRTPAAAAGRPGRRTCQFAHLGHPHRTGRLPRPHR